MDNSKSEHEGQTKRLFVKLNMETSVEDLATLSWLSPTLATTVRLPIFRTTSSYLSTARKSVWSKEDSKI